MPGCFASGNSELSPIPVMGVRWNKTAPSTSLTRLYASSGKAFVPSITSSAVEGHSDFDNMPVYKDIRLCNVVDGEPVAYLGDAGFSRTPAAGDVMVEIPRYYFKIEDTATYRELLISDQPLDGFMVSPRHAPRPAKPSGYERIYASAYNLDTNYRSVSGAAPKVSITRSAARAGCSARGATYWQEDIASYWTRALLYLVEVANTDSQSAVGPGPVNSETSASPIASGSTDAIAGHSGRVNTDTTQNPAKWRHMENLWGNTYQIIDGINFNGDTAYICTAPEVYADDTAAGYTALSYQKADAGGYIKALGFDSDYPWAQLPTDATGASGTYIPDNYSRGAGWQCMRTGGYYKNTGGQAGLFATDTGYDSAATYSYHSPRLIVLPDSPAILAVLFAPTGSVKVNTDFNITLSINRQTDTVTFFRDSGIGLGKSNISQTDMPDGTREYSCTLRLSSQGEQKIYVCPGSVLDLNNCKVITVTVVK